MATLIVRLPSAISHQPSAISHQPCPRYDPLSGARLGPYEIIAPLGAGGMGEVFRARDERLKRDVAIKIVHAASSADPDRLGRFEQEAHAAAP